MVVPRIRTITFWGLYWDTLILGNYHMSRQAPWALGRQSNEELNFKLAPVGALGIHSRCSRALALPSQVASSLGYEISGGLVSRV